jgi:hypothetical protein
MLPPHNLRRVHRLKCIEILSSVFLRLWQLLVRSRNLKVRKMINAILREQLYLLRQAVQEAFSKESVFSPERTDFLNALQGILEKCETAQAEHIDVDFEDLFVLHKNRHVINDAAHIHEAFMGNAELAASLRQVAENIESAQKNLWLPKSRTA